MVESLARVEDYFKMTRILLSSIGVWPYQSPTESRLALSIAVFIAGSLTISQIIALTEVRDFDIIVEVLAPLGGIIVCTVKITSLAMNKDKFKDLLSKIQEDFDNTVSDTEIEILQVYGKKSLNLSKTYAIGMYAITAVFILTPLLQALWQILNPHMDQTKSPKRLPFLVEYYVDTEEYYYPIMFHCFLASLVFDTIIIGTDTIFAICIQHGCAKFMILKYRLLQIVPSEESRADMYRLDRKDDDMAYQKVKACIGFHQEAIGFVDAIESAFTICLLFQAGICCLMISLMGLYATTKLDKPQELARFAVLILATMGHLLFFNWQSHELMDQSVDICDAVYDTEWYFVSTRVRKLLLQMMARSLEPCKITAGKLYLMSMENLSAVCTIILSTSMSYFTVLSSVREKRPDVVTE